MGHLKSRPSITYILCLYVTGSAFLHSSLGSNTFSAKRSTEPTKQPLKKPVTPVGRFDTPEESNVEKESLESKCGCVKYK